MNGVLDMLSRVNRLKVVRQAVVQPHGFDPSAVIPGRRNVPPPALHQGVLGTGDTIRPSLGGLRLDRMKPPIPGKFGVAILCFYGLASAKTALDSVLAHAKPEYEILLFDNSENWEIGAWMREKHPTVPYRRSPYNTGSWNARNRIVEHFGSLGCERAIIQDQDVVWVGDAVAPMAEVIRRYPDTGCVTWELAVTTMGNHRWDETGALSPPETPGMACMFSIAALAAGNDPDLRGWYPGYGLCYRGDSDVCFSLWSKGYKTRVVLNGTGMVRHEHPHQGIHRLGSRLATEQAFSLRVFAQRREKYQWPRL